MASSFNPFDKAPGEKLTADDLNGLVEREVAEGYYVEYKGEFPKNDKIGRSLASLANTYGGWYFVGIEADKTGIARNLKGFSLAEHRDPISKIQEIAKEQIDPTPVLYPQVVELPSGLYVLAVFVPGEQDTPFICRNGVVYRRIHESSDPIGENNRYALDRLYEGGKENEKDFARFCEVRRVLSDGENLNGWIQICIAPYPPGVANLSHRGQFADPAPDLDKFLKMTQEPLPLWKRGDEVVLSGNMNFFR